MLLEYPNSQNFSVQLPHLLKHIVEGEIRAGQCIGIHFFQEEKHRIAMITQEANTQGIWEAKIYVRHPKTNHWVAKKKPSTFFPTFWTQSVLIEKLSEAFHNKINTIGYKQIGETQCGISIVFLYKEDKVVSCFPLMEN